MTPLSRRHLYAATAGSTDQSGVIASGYPSASNTGPAAAGFTSLTPQVGDVHFTSSGQTITGLDITGKVYIEALNVTLQGCKIHGSSVDYLVEVNEQNCTLIDCEIAGDGDSTAQAPLLGLVKITADNAVVRRNNMYYSSGDGINLGQASDLTISDNYIHDWVTSPTNSPSYDGICFGPTGGNHDNMIQHNTILLWNPTYMNYAISLAVGPGKSLSRIECDNNFLAGGNAYFYGGGDLTYTGFVFTNNRLSQQYAAETVMTMPPVWGSNSCSWGGSGVQNKWYETLYGKTAGATVPAP